MNSPKIITDVAVEPLTVDECRAHLEAQLYGDTGLDDIDDAMIEGWLSAAREYCEDFLGLSLATKTLEIALDEFPTSLSVGGKYIELPMGPVRDILFISGEEPSSDMDSDSELDPTTYVLDTYRTPNRIAPVSSWPIVTAATNAIVIRYLAGYGVDSDGGQVLPKSIRAAILLILGHLYAHRENDTEVALTTIPTGAEALMRPRRVRLGMA
jgi:uncharacterized phiE125 gp8 family phage protein